MHFMLSISSLRKISLLANVGDPRQLWIVGEFSRWRGRQREL
jgi:hypothetical protein